MLALLVATPLLFLGCAAKKNPYAECDKLEPTLEVEILCLMSQQKSLNKKSVGRELKEA